MEWQQTVLAGIMWTYIRWPFRSYYDFMGSWGALDTAVETFILTFALCGGGIFCLCLVISLCKHILFHFGAPFTSDFKLYAGVLKYAAGLLSHLYKAVFS